MSFKNFIPAIWAAAILEPLEKALVFAAPDAVNRDYEGQITQAGDRVVINTISDPTIAPYTPNSTVITPEELTSADQELIIDQSPYFAFKVDDVDKRQSAGGGRILTTALRRAAYKLRDEVDQYVAALYAGAQSDNQITTTSITSPTLALQYLSETGREAGRGQRALRRPLRHRSALVPRPAAPRQRFHRFGWRSRIPSPYQRPRGPR